MNEQGKPYGIRPGTKQCVGVKVDGSTYVLPHEASTETDFAVVRSRPDGLSRNCRSCASLYGGLRPGASPKARERAMAKIGETVGKPPRVVNAEAKVTVPAKAKAVVSPIRLPEGPEVETEAGQATLAEAAETAAAARRSANAEARRRQRAAKKLRDAEIAAALVNRA